MDRQLVLKGKVIVISGGTKGIGRALALACAAAGAGVVIGGRDEQVAAAILQDIRNDGSRGLFVPTDLRRPETCKTLFDKTVDAFGRVDGFVNYAGVTPAASLLETPPEMLDEVMDVNFKAAFLCCRYAIENMEKQGGGSIVLVNSCHADHGEKDRAAYACSKGALWTLAEHISHHYAGQGIRCNTLTMGWSLTDGERKLREKQGIPIEEIEKCAAEAIPMGRMQTAEDYIPGFLYLLSDESSMVTGANLRISGGLYL